ncbi:hypothetical protein T4E_9875 [Trichinella pseudospiralis]|uniref:Uncharacterized protein n=1 Tax=Trichinella pseudospiralis TaxID=6337 RepID=A0A0V0XXU0_TRIPS|nr:hypothetical protein T4E_9875 [Trichinella pseudospiralis]
MYVANACFLELDCTHLNAVVLVVHCYQTEKGRCQIFHSNIGVFPGVVLQQVKRRNVVECGLSADGKADESELNYINYGAIITSIAAATLVLLPVSGLERCLSIKSENVQLMTVDHVVASPTFSSRSHPAVASLITSKSDALHTWWHSRRGDREVGILQPSEYDQRVLLGSVETKRRSRLAMSATGKAESSQFNFLKCGNPPWIVAAKYYARLASNNQHPTRASHFEISYRRSRMPSNADTREKAKKRQRMKGYRCMKSDKHVVAIIMLTALELPQAKFLEMLQAICK